MIFKFIIRDWLKSYITDLKPGDLLIITHMSKSK
jgi:hypothetical protein